MLGYGGRAGRLEPGRRTGGICLLREKTRRREVNSVDSGDLGVPVLVVECGHCSGARAHWWAPKPGNPPDLWFENFPRKGRVMLANKTILLACAMCSRQLDVIRAEYGKTVVL